MNCLRILYPICLLLSFGCGDSAEGPATADAAVSDAIQLPDLSLVDSDSPADSQTPVDHQMVDMPAPPDSGTADLAPMSDTQVPADQTLDQSPDQFMAADMGEQPLNCNAIGICSEDCGKACPAGLAKFGCLIKCSDDCKAKGCATAQSLFTPLNDCIQAKCLVDCLGGPGTACTNCTVTKCAAETATCNAHSC